MVDHELSTTCSRCLGAVVLTFECTSESPGGLLKTLAGPPIPELLILRLWGGA